VPRTQTHRRAGHPSCPIPAREQVGCDAGTTPASGLCTDPSATTLSVGNLYSGGGGSLNDGWVLGAHVSEIAWGTNAPQVYGTYASQIDSFLVDKQDATVVVAAGNAASASNQPTISDPATAKNAIIVGATYSLNEGFAPDPDEEDR